MLFQRNLKRVLKTSETLAGSQVFILAGVGGAPGSQVPCTPNTEHAGNFVELGGLEYEINLSLFARGDNFAGFDSTLITFDQADITFDSDNKIPILGHNITFRDRTYKVVRIHTDGALAFLRFDLADPNRAAK